ncbi:unnamed protein product, partial [Rotaria sp. Silwood2]
MDVTNRKAPLTIAANSH